MCGHCGLWPVALGPMIDLILNRLGAMVVFHVGQRLPRPRTLRCDAGKITGSQKRDLYQG